MLGSRDDKEDDSIDLFISSQDSHSQSNLRNGAQTLSRPNNLQKAQSTTGPTLLKDDFGL